MLTKSFFYLFSKNSKINKLGGEEGGSSNKSRGGGKNKQVTFVRGVEYMACEKAGLKLG